MFAYRLALELGEPHPEKLLEELPARTFARWCAYARLEPWRLADEDARTYALPSPEQVAAKGRAIMKKLMQLQAARRKGG